uniref:Uncharacterized protein n=1 Tax=Arundo donax TaxID=35708 RepID=A0A0A8ZWG8_ARUDO
MFDSSCCSTRLQCIILFEKRETTSTLSGHVLMAHAPHSFVLSPDFSSL